MSHTDLELFSIVIEYFIETTAHEVYNIAHIVFDDSNYDDKSIDFAINYLDTNRVEYLHDHKGVTDTDIDRVRDCLVFIRTLPESYRVEA